MLQARRPEQQPRSPARRRWQPWPPGVPRARPMPQSLNQPRDAPDACRQSRAPGARRSRPSSPVRHRRALSAHEPGGRQDARQRQRPRQQAPRPARSRPQTTRHGHGQRRQHTRRARAPPGRASVPADRYLPRPARESAHRARRHHDRQWRAQTRPESGPKPRPKASGHRPHARLRCQKRSAAPAWKARRACRPWHGAPRWRAPRRRNRSPPARTRRTGDARYPRYRCGGNRSAGSARGWSPESFAGRWCTAQRSRAPAAPRAS